MRKKQNSLLAIDPGTRHLGFASFEDRNLEDYGVKDVGYVAGAEDVFAAIATIMDRLMSQKRPQAVVLEKNNFSQIQQNIRLTLAIGKIKQVARRHRIRVFELDPRTIRKVVCRNGNATKRELARTVSVRYPEMLAYLESNRRWRERYYQNAFDAIAVGLAFQAMASTFDGSRSRQRTRQTRSK